MLLTYNPVTQASHHIVPSGVAEAEVIELRSQYSLDILGVGRMVDLLAQQFEAEGVTLVACLRTHGCHSPFQHVRE